eukprot:scaffold28279_cov134-Isochrysis_galbana.AAC.5
MHRLLRLWRLALPAPLPCVPPPSDQGNFHPPADHVIFPVPPLALLDPSPTATTHPSHPPHRPMSLSRTCHSRPHWTTSRRSTRHKPSAL